MPALWRAVLQCLRARRSSQCGNANPVGSTTLLIGVKGSSLRNHCEAITMSNTDLSIPTIHFLDGLTITLSYEIPQFFNRRHDNMLKKIINLVCSAEFTALNLKASEYLDVTRRKLPCYQITKGGFLFLVIGFTGKRTAVFKEADLNAFKAMEKPPSPPFSLCLNFM